MGREAGAISWPPLFLVPLSFSFYIISDTLLLLTISHPTFTVPSLPYLASSSWTFLLSFLSFSPSRFTILFLVHFLFFVFPMNWFSQTLPNLFSLCLDPSQARRQLCRRPFSALWRHVLLKIHNRGTTYSASKQQPHSAVPKSNQKQVHAWSLWSQDHPDC
jgi:hypothetical protein